MKRTNLFSLYKNIFIFGMIIMITACSVKPEKLATKYCECLEENHNLSAREKIILCDTLLAELYDWNDNQQDIFDKKREVDSILKVSCPEYNKTEKYLTGNAGDWKMLTDETETILTENECESFKEYSNFYYLEPDGDTTSLTIKDGWWIDNFSNGKYFSYLKLNWLSPCEFEIELVETSEPNRKAAYSKGEKFRYRILDKDSGYFIMMVTYKEQHQQFLLYFI